LRTAERGGNPLYYGPAVDSARFDEIEDRDAYIPGKWQLRAPGLDES